jgi:hypothetical protein
MLTSASGSLTSHRVTWLARRTASPEILKSYAQWQANTAIGVSTIQSRASAIQEKHRRSGRLGIHHQLAGKQQEAANLYTRLAKGAETSDLI